jgi:hypothetical protein
MRRWVKNSVIVIGIVLATFIVTPFVILYLLGHVGQSGRMMQSLHQLPAELARPCSVVIADMNSSDPVTAMIAQGLVFDAIKDKLNPEDREAGSHELSGRLSAQFSEFKAACNQAPNRPIREFLQDNNPEADKKENL